MDHSKSEVAVFVQNFGLLTADGRLMHGDDMHIAVL